MIIKQTSNNNNILSELLIKQFDTMDFPKSDLDHIKDFPVLKKKELCYKIFYGHFRFRMSKSYVNDLIKLRYCYMPSRRYLASIKNEELK